jgi:hypothetical protein
MCVCMYVCECVFFCGHPCICCIILIEFGVIDFHCIFTCLRLSWWNVEGEFASDAEYSSAIEVVDKYM